MFRQDELFRNRAVDYYSKTFRVHGSTARGVDWPNEASQLLRFQQLLRIVPPGEDEFVLLDYGCGYGALFQAMASTDRPFRYIGYDPAAELLAAAREGHAGDDRCRFVDCLDGLERVDYAVASGIWNVKQDATDAAWLDYLLHELAHLDRLATDGFAFNVLTAYGDPDKRRPDLFYADPARLFDHCMRTFSRKTALLHDYPLYEFTMLVRKEHLHTEV